MQIQLTPWSRVLFEKLILVQSQKIPSFMEAEGSSPCSEEYFQ
jgi:hypothetical protein